MLIPHKQLTPEALQGLIEEFVSRDGTDYGEREIPLAVKVDQVRKQLDQGVSVIVYDDQGGTSIIARADLPAGSDNEDLD